MNVYISELLRVRKSGREEIALLAASPNSAAVLEAAIKASSLNGTPMLFAATLYQVDLDGAYTGWTTHEFVSQIHLWWRIILSALIFPAGTQALFIRKDRERDRWYHLVMQKQLTMELS